MNILERYFTKNKNIKKVGILVAIALIIFLITFILWETVFSNYYIFNRMGKIIYINSNINFNIIFNN